jgi:hypothetical protein
MIVCLYPTTHQPVQGLLFFFPSPLTALFRRAQRRRVRRRRPMLNVPIALHRSPQCRQNDGRLWEGPRRGTNPCLRDGCSTSDA